MVKLKGPAMSTAASGTLGDLLTFGKLRTTHTLRKRPKPTDPKTGAQISMRAIMQFLTAEWTSLGAPNQATWADAPEKRSGSNYNAYLSHNLKRWRENKPPTQAYPAAQTLTATAPVAPWTTAGPRDIIHQIHSTAPYTPTWGIIIFHKPAMFPSKNWYDAIHITNAATATAKPWTQSNPGQGWHYYIALSFSTDGNLKTFPSPTDTALII